MTMVTDRAGHGERDDDRVRMVMGRLRGRCDLVDLSRREARPVAKGDEREVECDM